MTDYEALSLRVEEATFRVQLLALLLQVVALGAAVASVWFLLAQVKEQVQATTAQYHALEASVYQDLMSKQFDLHKILIENPKIREHLFRRRTTSKDRIPAEVLGAIHYYLDFFQLIYSQRGRLRALQDETGPDWRSWKNTIAAAFEGAPVLCEVLHDTKEHYGDDFIRAVFETNRWCTRQSK
jgi:hypothetical protein